MTLITEKNLFDAMDRDIQDRTVFLALADWYEEWNMLDEARVWRLIGNSDREPIHPDEHTNGEFWWRHGCGCAAKMLILTKECTHQNSQGLTHLPHLHILGSELITKPGIKTTPLQQKNHPLFLSNSGNTGSIVAFPSRSEAFKHLAKRLLECGL